MVKPKHILSFSYDFSEKMGAVIASIEMPFLAKLLKSNSATVLAEGKSYLLVDAITVADVGGQRSTNTYLELEGKRVVELTYDKQGLSNECFTINHVQSNQKLEVRLAGFGTFLIVEGGEAVGTLFNRDLLLRKSRLEMKKTIPLLSQVVLFWGSINTQNIV